MSIRNHTHRQSIRNYPLDINNKPGLEEYQMKIDSLVEVLESEFTQQDYEIDFQLVYAKTYEICLNRMAKELYSSVKKMFEKILKSYNDTLVKLNDASPNYDFFNTLVKLFQFYKTKLEQIADALSYMERIDQADDESIQPLVKKGMKLFYNTIIFDPNLKDKLFSAVIREINQLRLNNYQFSEKFIILFSIFTDRSYGAFYSSDLKEMLINETSIFYENTCKLFIQEITTAEEEKKDNTATYKIITEMIQKLNNAVENENKLFKDVEDKESILKTIFDIMIKRNYDHIRKKGMNKFFKNNDTKGYRTLYTIFFSFSIENTNDYTAFFYSTFQEILDKQMRKLGDTFVIIKPNKPVEYLNFPRYIDEICEMRRNCNKLLLSSFDQNIKLEHIIKSVFEKYINQSTSFLQNFVKLIHEEIKLCQKIRNNKSLIDFLDKFPIVFKLINDKDLFEEEYRLSLSKRLIRNASMIKESEFDFYSIMRKESGINYVKKIQNMISDIFHSKDINVDFRIQLAKKKEKLSIDFYTKILSQDNWPIDKEIISKLLQDQSKREPNMPMSAIVYTSTPIALPPSFDKCLQEFTQYYVDKLKNRYVTFVHELSWAELKVNINNQSYLFIVSTFQLVILMLFNQSTRLDMKSISSSSKINEEHLHKYCYPLIKLGILNQEKNCLSLNDQFTSNRYKHNCNYTKEEKRQGIIQEANKEVSHLVIEDRKHQIDAAIISQLKQMKKIKFDDLKNSIMNRVNSYFTPEIAFIKERLDNLIDRNYIEREESNQNIYVYIP